MTEFGYCPECQGNAAIDGIECAACGGSGKRAVTAENLELAISAREWADDQVESFFSTWCRITGLHHAYGVESWSTGSGELRIVQDTSCRGCHDTTSHTFPIAWLLATGKERERLITEDVAARRAEAARKRQVEKREELERARAYLASLEAER